jgi:hypothetical protein
MGMFDYFRSSYDLGKEFTNVVCQTKDIEDGYGGTMTDYWLDPSGKLWYPSYSGCYTMEIFEEDHPKYDPKRKWMNFEWVRTGSRGKVILCYITKYIEVYPENWKGEWEDWPRMRLHFKYGIIQDFENVTGKYK